MQVLPGKRLELVRMEQAPLRVFPRAHFPRRELCALFGVELCVYTVATILFLSIERPFLFLRRRLSARK
jgi:hypothetical protein